MHSVVPLPSTKILSALVADPAPAELTLALHFDETDSPAQVLRRWQVDERVHALLHRVGARHRPLPATLPAALADSETYRALEGSAAGFVVQFAALCAWQDRWGRQALLAYPNSSHGLWRALAWSGTARSIAAGMVANRVVWRGSP